jgi:hypothetical protein
MGSAGAPLEGAQIKNPPPGSLLAVGLKLFLPCYLFLHSPEAVIVDVVTVVIRVVIRFAALHIMAKAGYHANVAAKSG